MGYIEKTLIKDETIVSQFNIHTIFYVGPVLFFWLILPLFQILQLKFIEIDEKEIDKRIKSSIPSTKGKL